jgi:hypothetical protein
MLYLKNLATLIKTVSKYLRNSCTQ